MEFTVTVDQIFYAKKKEAVAKYVAILQFIAPGYAVIPSSQTFKTRFNLTPRTSFEVANFPCYLDSSGR